MSHTQKALAVVIGVIFLLVGFRFFFYNPVAGRLAELREESSDLDQRISAARIKEAGLPEIEERIVEARQSLSRLEVRYPPSIESVYRTVTEAARETGMRILRRETSEKPDEGQALRIYEIRIVAHSPYRVLGEFLDRIISSPILITVSSLTVSAEISPSLRDGTGDQLRVDMKLTTYLRRADGV